MSEPLPFNPNISQLKKQAKDLKRLFESGDVDAVHRVDGHGIAGPGISLRECQLIIARELGFDGWHDLLDKAGEKMVDEGDVHRWFGVRLNNSSWNRLDAGEPNSSSPEADRLEFLYAAYASAYHWSQVGGIANRARGEHLISRVALRVGEFEDALVHARRCHQLVTSHPGEVEDWDLGFALEATARALAAVGQTDEARRVRAEVLEVIAAVVGEEDKAILEAEFNRGEWFGID